jgi:hypothetical protein
MDDVANYQRACESAQTMVQDYLTGYPPFMDEDAAIPLVPCNTDGAPLVADVPFEYVELRMPNGANLKFGLRLGNDPRKCTRRAASCAYCGASCKGITCSNRCNAKRTNASRATPLGGDQSAHPRWKRGIAESIARKQRAAQRRRVGRVLGV